MKVSGTNVDSSAAANSHVHTAHSAKKSSKASEGDSAQLVEGAKGEASEATRSDISPKGREFANAKAVANAAPDVREEKIAKLKEMIAANKYKVDSNAVADRMVDEHLSSGID